MQYFVTVTMPDDKRVGATAPSLAVALKAVKAALLDGAVYVSVAPSN